MLVDSMSNCGDELYEANPERLFIIENGIVAYQGGMGPFLYSITEVDENLANRFSDQLPITGRAFAAAPTPPSSQIT